MRAYVGLVAACLMIVALTYPVGSIVAQTELASNSETTLESNITVASSNFALVDMLGQVDTGRLLGHIDALQHMITRHVNSAQNMAGQGIGEADRYITSQFEAIRDQSGNLEVFQEEFWIRWDRDSQQRNVVAVIRGSDALAGTLVVGAHYDSTSANLHDGLAYAPGANDNASGVAALIEMAQILSAHRPQMTIVFVAFSAEEIGSSGSKHFIQDYIQAQEIDIRAMINLDIIGGSIGQDASLNHGAIQLFSAGPENSASRQLAHTIQSICLTNAVPMEILVQDSVDRLGHFGDQKLFSDAGYPAVRFIEAVEDVNRQDNGMDTMDYIQPDYLRQATQTVLAVVTVLAAGSTAIA